jgi:acetyl-CoA decarbonylase/synthase complex subunit gamma
MALSGIQIYNLLPKTNCKDCGFPTCLAFAMKLAAKQVELATCPHVTEASKTQLAESSAPPVRLITLKSKTMEFSAGNEVVLFRHEKTFYRRPGLLVRVKDSLPLDSIKALVAQVDSYAVGYVGMDLTIDGFAVESVSGSAATFAAAVKTVRSLSSRPLALVSGDAAVITAGLAELTGERPLICGADEKNWEAMAAAAKASQSSLVARAASLEGLAALADKIKAAGVEDLVLEPANSGLSGSLAHNTLIRRLAIKKNFRALGYPILCFAGVGTASPLEEAVVATQAIAKYAGFIVLDNFLPELVYPLLVLRQNIYTDPQKPIQVQPGLYEINSPKPDSPLLVTTNFSITYFSVANEVEGSGLPAWLLVVDAEGMSVLTAWAAGKFDADRIAKAVKTFNVADKLQQKRIILPGHVAVLSGEVEEQLAGWEIKVGPREAVDIPSFLKKAL